MPIHDWTRVTAGIFHDFHHEWISTIKRALNAGLLPPGYYALAEQITGGMGPDVLTLEAPVGLPNAPNPKPGGTGVALATRPPQVRFRARTEPDLYAQRAKAVVVRHTSDHSVVAMIELVSPGNKGGRAAIDSFVRKAQDAIRSGIHLLIVDLFPPGPRDPEGIHRLIWDDREGSFPLPPDAPLTCVAYLAGDCPEVFLDPTSVGNALPEMPLFLTSETYIPVPLEATYQAAWEAVPAIWREALTTDSPRKAT